MTMKEFDQKKTSLQKSLKLNDFSFKANRLVFKASLPEAALEVPSSKPEKIDTNNPDFDNLAFQQEKVGTYAKSIDNALKAALNNVPQLKEKPELVKQLQKEFTTGLIERVLENKSTIAQAVKTKFGALAGRADDSNFSNENAFSWFQDVLTALDCTKLGLVYDNTDDTTKFRFYGKNGEILFKSADIKIQYVPKSLQDSAETVSESSEQPREFQITKIEKLAKNRSIDHVELIEKYYGRAPLEGERVVVKRGRVEIKGRFNSKKNLFISEDGVQVWFIGNDNKYKGDKVTFYPNPKEKPGAVNTVELGDKTYIVLRQIETKSSYLDVATAILKYQTGHGAIVDGAQILDDQTCASIVKSGISVAEYAGLLKAAHEKIGKENRLPVVLPLENLERKHAVRTKIETGKAAAVELLARKESAEAIMKQLSAGLEAARGSISAAEFSKCASYLMEYQVKLAQEKKPQERASIIKDLIEELDNYFSESGFTVKISEKLERVMDAGKDGNAWEELWIKENPTVDRVMNVIKANPGIFGKQNKNKVRGIVYDLIETGNSSQFDSGDIIKYFGIKLPNQRDYDEILGLAIVPDAKAPDLKSQQDAARNYVTAIEGLRLAIAGLDPSQNKEVVATARKYEKLAENAPTGAKNLKHLIDLLNVDGSTPIITENNRTWACTIEKGGKKLTLRLQEQGAGGQYIRAVDPETGAQVWEEWDYFGFDAPDYVDKINSLIASQSKTKSGEKLGEKLDSVNVKGGTYYSLTELETLSQSVPGIPVKELFNVRGTKKVRLFKDLEGIGETNLAKKTRSILESLGIYGSAKFVDTPKNKVELKNNDQVLINIRYKGKDFTLHINNATVGWGVRMKPGFNNESAKNGDTAYKTAGGLNVESVVQGIDNIIANKGYFNTERMKVAGNIDRVTISKSVLDQYSQAIDKYRQTSGYTYELRLNSAQLMEVLFRAYTFDSLKAMGCVKKVNGQEKAFVITKLPNNFQTLGTDEQLRNLIYATKYGTTRGYEALKSSAGEKALEAGNKQAKYENRLKKLFAVGLADFSDTGKKVTMADVDSGSTTNYSKDEYFKKVSGNAAYNDFYEQIRTRDDKGTEVININKANIRLNQLYQAGLVKLRVLARTNSYYGELQKQVTNAVKTRKVDLNAGLTDLDQKIIRLGYLQDIEQKEQDQSKVLEQFKAKLVESILKLLPDKIADPKNPGHYITKEQAAATLKDLPIGILLSYSRNSAAEGAPEIGGAGAKNTLGVYVPIILDVFDSPYAKLVLLPGVNTSDGLKFAVGAAFTSKDPNDKDQRVIFMGGISVGLGTTFNQASFGAAIGGGVDFKIIKADEIDNYNHYLGISGGVGFDITKNPLGGFGAEVGPGYTWEIDAQQKYTNSLKEYFTKAGLQKYIDQLKDIYVKGSDSKAIDKFCTDLKADPAMAQKIGLRGPESNEEILIAFEQYVAGTMEKFNENFNLPTVVGGQLKLGVVSGSIIAIGAATGDIPVVIGGTVIWGIQFLGSLKFNIGSQMVIERQQKTSEEEMSTFSDVEKQKQFDAAFASLPKSAAASKLFTSGRTTLDVSGQKQTSMGVEVKSSGAELPTDNLGKKMAAFNQSLADQSIDMQLRKGPDNRIEIVLLDSKVASNDKILISPNLVITEGNRLFLKDPNQLQFLYFNKQTRKYPLETSHSASMETVITISDNRFYKGDTFPTETSITRFADNKDRPIIEGKTGKAEAFVETDLDYTRIAESQGRMKKALDKSSGIEVEPVRPDLKKIAKDLIKYRKNRETFVSITNAKAKANLANPDYLSEKVYKFYDDFAVDKKLKPFNASEKALLTLELSTLRYTELQRGSPSAIERAARFRERLNWAKETMLPYFQTRLRELQTAGKLTLKAGETVESRAKILVDKAIDDLQYLDTTMPSTKLPEGTSVGIAIGRGGRGLHQILDGTRDKLQTDEVDQYGYIMGKDYTEAIRSGQPPEDHDIGLILMGQLSTLPESTDLKGFMDSNLARKLASNGGLAFILGKEDYAKVTEYYESGIGDAAGLSKFIDIVKQIREAEQKGQELISVKGYQDVNFLIKVNPRVQAGVFQKCGNYSAAINEEIAIIPPSQSEALALMASGSEARTTLTTKAYKQFTGLFGGVTAAVAFVQPSEGGGGGGHTPAKPEAPAKGEVKQKPGGPILPPTRPGTPQAPGNVPTGPSDDSV